MPQPRIVVVDTNCYVRLLYSPLRPLLGKVVAGLKFMTTADLAAETMFQKGLGGRQSWLADPAIQADLAAAIVKLREPKKSRMLEEAHYFRRAGNTMLRTYCTAQNIHVRELSTVDAKAWATAVQINGILATDEWPLRKASNFIDADDQGNKLPLFHTLELLALLEGAGELTSLQRLDMMRNWRMSDEKLHRNADAEYRRLFGEEPPNAQAGSSHNA